MERDRAIRVKHRHNHVCISHQIAFQQWLLIFRLLTDFSVLLLASEAPLSTLHSLTLKQLESKAIVTFTLPQISLERCWRGMNFCAFHPHARSQISKRRLFLHTGRAFSSEGKSIKSSRFSVTCSLLYADYFFAMCVCYKSHVLCSIINSDFLALESCVSPYNALLFPTCFSWLSKTKFLIFVHVFFSSWRFVYFCWRVRCCK